jgi:hypothetical protein
MFSWLYAFILRFHKQSSPRARLIAGNPARENAKGIYTLKCVLHFEIES